MSRDNIVYTVFGFILGLAIGSFLLGPRLARSKLAGSERIVSDAGAAGASAMPAGDSAAPARADSGAGMPGGGAMPAGGMQAVQQQLQDLKSRIARDPKDTDALRQLGTMYMDVGKYPEAVSYFEQALQVREDPNLRTELGICYKQAGQLDKAYDSLKRVADESPGEWQPLYNLAIVLGELHRVPEAREQLAKLKQLRPNDPEVAKLEQALAAVK